MNDNIITYRVYNTLQEVAIAYDLLTQAEIPAFMSGTDSTLYAPVPIPAGGGYALNIFERDLPRVAALLDRQ